jgi:hypothetical protein
MPFRFTGQNLRVTVDLEPADGDEPDSRYHVILREQ